MDDRVLVCLPVYNEADNVGEVLDDILRLRLRLMFDILVVNDGSTDDTVTVCQRSDVSVISHLYNMGYGAALKTAYRYANKYKYDYVIQVDADGQHDVCNIENLYITLTSNTKIKPDIVIGSRFLQDRIAFSIAPHKMLVIRMLRAIIRMATHKNITDPTSGLQGLSRKAFCYYSKFNCFAIDYPDANMIIQMILKDFVVDEIPAVMHQRIAGTSMHHGIFRPIKYVVEMMLSLIITYLREGFNKKKG